MNKEAEKIGIPESITINGSTYVVKDSPELLDFIQQVAKVEKTKLYSQMDTLREEIKKLQGVSVEAQPVNLDALADRLADKFITKETLDDKFTELKELFPQMIKEVVQPVLNDTAQRQQNELESYRQEIIQQNAATCIPDLVKGNTKEELDASLQESIRIRAAYPSPTGQPVKTEVPANAPGGQSPTPPPAAAPAAPKVPAAPRREAPAAEAETGIKSMSMDEFAQRRGQLQKQLEQMYGGNH